jgi:hypothetical protein
MKMMSAGFLIEPQNQDRWFLPVYTQNWWLGFFGLGLKTNNSGLTIWASKSLQQFLDLVLKTKRASTY